MKKLQNKNLRWIFLPLALLMIGAELCNCHGQWPAAFEQDLDKLNTAFYKALKIIETENESEAIRKLATLKPQLRSQAEAFAERWGDVVDLTEEEEIALGEKMLQKELYREMMALMADDAFNQKISRSQALMKEYQELMGFLDMEEEGDDMEETGVSGSLVISFTVEGGVPYSGTYSVSASEDEAHGMIDEYGLFAVEISSTLDGGEFQFVMLSEKTTPGTSSWTMENQILIQSWDGDQNEHIQLSSYYNEGKITFDRIEQVGGWVTGSFAGKFFDDTQHTEKPVQVRGTFQVKRISNAN